MKFCHHCVGCIMNALRMVFFLILKISRVVSVLKTGDCERLENFRPISIIPIFAKIFEKILLKQLYNYFDNMNLFSNSQNGFRKGKSTVTAINQLLLRIVQGFEDGDYVACLFCDLSKAFDCVNHDLLIEKLQCYGIRDKSLALLASYLSNRKQIVTYNGKSAKELFIRDGVPQGSVLGPLLFLIYVNDLPDFIQNANFVIFADDTTFVQKDGNLDELLRNIDKVSNQVYQWFESNKLTLNQNKTKKLIFSLRALAEYKDQEPAKFLGMILDQN